MRRQCILNAILGKHFQSYSNSVSLHCQKVLGIFKKSQLASTQCELLTTAESRAKTSLKKRVSKPQSPSQVAVPGDRSKTVILLLLLVKSRFRSL